MTQTPIKLLNPETFNQNHDPKIILSWLINALSGQLTPNQDINWLSLAEIASFKANQNNDLKWAEISIKIYDYLAEKSDKKKRGSGESFKLSAMMLRSLMMQRLGTSVNDEILDINIILAWFKDSLNLSFKDVLIKTENWRTLPIENIRELRQIKNRLKVIQGLAESDHITLDKFFCQWLDLLPKLP